MKNILAKVLISSAFFAAAGTVALSAAPNPYKNTFCNPLNIDYNFWESYREAADPGVIVFKGDYYLFASHSDGYWWSADMLNWHFVKPTGIKLTDYAPTVETIGDTLFFTAGGSYLFKTTDPKAGVWTTAATTVLGPVDPCLFCDDDGKFYCYSGCSANGVLEIIQSDPAANFNFVGKKDTCIKSNRPAHGFEVPGDNNENLTGDSWIEGSWLTKYKGVYYLQYAVPGTQYRSYADGCYTASSARGPFTFCQQSPICMRPQGFVTGTGHSCTFQDVLGAYWHATTVVISVAHMFERRLAIFPAGFDPAGWLHSDTYLGDYPQYLPGKASANAENNLFGCMLLSFKKACAASSALSGHPVSDAFDENIKTWWSATSANSGEWLRVDLGKSCEVGAIQTNFAEQDITYAGGRGTSFSHKYKIEGAEDTTGTWKMLVNKTANSADVPHDYTPLDSLVNIRYIKITNAGPMPGGGKFAIRDLRIFGNAHCNPPAGATAFSVSRTTADKRTATVTWTKVADADGYIIRLGIAPDKLYNNYQVLSKDSVSCVIRSLNVGVTYYFSLDTYNSCGVTKGVAVKRDDNVTSAGIPVRQKSGIFDGGTYKIFGKRFTLPRGLVGKSFIARVYDVSGKLVYSSIVKEGILELEKSAIRADGVYIVNVTTVLDGVTVKVRR